MANGGTLSKTLARTLRVGPFDIGLYHLAVVGLFCVGAFVRLYGIGTMYTGLHADEASIAYDAWAIANYGIDRNGMHLPAYLIAWGSGQNAGYAWLLIPFIKLFGLSLTTLRLPMALAGCASLWALYTILRRSGSKKLVLIGLFLLSICPWHILKSRWAMESNLFPEMLLWGTALLIAGIASRKKRWFYLAFAVFGLSAWAYAISYLFLPLYLIPAAIILWRKKVLPSRHILGCFGVLAATAWPIILFALITLFNLPTIQLPFLTIPRMPYPRVDDVALFSASGLADIRLNLADLSRLFTAQAEDRFWTFIQGYGIIYLCSMPFAVVGFVRCVTPGRFLHGPKQAIRHLVPGGWLFVLWMAAAGFIAVVIRPGIIRANTLWLPLVWFWVMGVYEVCRHSKVWTGVLSGFYALFFVLMCRTYQMPYVHQLNYALDAGFVQAAQYAEQQAFDDVYVDPGFEQVYSKILYATLPPPQDFIDSITATEPGPYGTVTDFGRWHCYPPESREVSADYAVILKEDEAPAYEAAGWKLTAFGYYFVAESVD